MNRLKSLLQKKTALVLVDLQNDFCHHEGTANKRGTNVQDFQQTFKQISTLLKTMRGRNSPIIHVVSEHSIWSESPSKMERYGRTDQDNQLAYCEPKSWGSHIYDLFLPTHTEKVIVKHRYSAFVQTDLELILRASKIEHIIVAGLYTNICIDSTARDGFMRDFYVTVPSDCVGSNDEEKHKYALHLLKGTFAEVVHSSNIINELTTMKTT